MRKLRTYKWKPNKVLIIGAGGIGSFFIDHLYNAIMNDQIPIDIEFEIVDNDTVELKNIRYQNFKANDVLKNKAKVMSKRYEFVGYDRKIESEKDLEGYDAVIIAVDNSKARKLVYDYCYSNNKWFLDMRAEGRQIAVLTSDLDKKEAQGTLPKQVNDNGGSCQLKYEFDKGIIQYGNVIVSSMGIQTILNKLRGETYNPKIIMRV